MITVHGVADIVGGTIASASILFRIFPPPEKFAAYPNFQNWYRLGYIFLSWIAFNK